VQEIPGTAEPRVPEVSFYDLLQRASPRFFVTPTLIAVNVLYFVAAVLFGVSPFQPEREQLLALGANYGPLVLEGQWWRLASANFVHIGFLHLLFNMWGLWILGAAAERMFGNFTFLLIYFLSGIGGSLASFASHPSILSAGASGAVFGIAGALMSMLYFGHILVPRQVVRNLLSSLSVVVGFNLLMGSMVVGIDNAGHLGGLAVGLGLGAALHRSIPAGLRPRYRFLVVPAVVLLFVAVARMTVERSGSDPELLAENARTLASEGNKAAAIETLEKAVALAPDSTVLVNELGAAYLDSERTEEAIAQFQRAVELDPQLYEPQRNLAVALALAKRHDEAREAFRIARRMEPSDVSLYLFSSQHLMEAGRADEAVPILEEALKWAPESAPVVSQMGLVRLRLGETALALDAFRKAVALAPEDPEQHNRLALGLSRAREGDCGLEAIEKALSLLPDAPHLLDSLGTVRFARGELEEAIAAYRGAVVKEPERAVYRYNLSVALASRGAALEAREERAEALRLDPDLEVPEDGLPIL
jgi:membrane associated rhomboid family serine protease/Flp pilus assembly protein TadD